MTDLLHGGACERATRAARDRLHGAAIRTPTDELRPNVLLKREDLQRSGSFKFRGVLNVLLGRPSNSREVVVASTGNTALAACELAAGMRLHVRACIPTTVGSDKRNALKERGAEVIDVVGGFAETARVARGLAELSGAAYISPGADALFAIGLGTVCAEILEDTPQVTEIVVPCGGGGLLIGVGALARARHSTVSVVGVQMAESPYLHALFNRLPLSEVIETPTCIDSLAGELEDGALAFAELHRVCDEMRLVSEAQACEAQTRFRRSTGAGIDLGAAAGLAGVNLDVDIETITCVIVTGTER